MSSTTTAPAPAKMAAAKKSAAKQAAPAPKAVAKKAAAPGPTEPKRYADAALTTRIQAARTRGFTCRALASLANPDVPLKPGCSRATPAGRACPVPGARRGRPRRTPVATRRPGRDRPALTAPRGGAPATGRGSFA